MIVVKLQGGLGNQMFQYAIGKLKAEQQGVELFFDLSFFDDQVKRPGFTPRQFELGIFNPQYKQADAKIVRSFFIETQSKQIRKFLGLPYKKKIREDICEYDPAILSLKAPIYLDGYFQSEEYYQGKETMIRNLFEFPNIFNMQLADISLLMETSNAVAVHFRRGDYVDDPVVSSIHNLCTLDYYSKAFQLMKERLNDPHFFIFSDDIDWVKCKVAGWEHQITFVKAEKVYPSWVDMKLMSRCKHHIIANSSFSWWGAWLNTFPLKVVVAPELWFNHNSIDTKKLVPNTWIRI
jgi:hypothetical protein